MKNLKEKRKKYGISQMELAKFSGVSRYQISLQENDFRNLNKVEEAKIKVALGTLSKKKIKDA